MGRLTDRRASGTEYTTGIAGELHEGETLSCVHCQFTWSIQRGSVKHRGFCTKCMGYVCGPACFECVPIERRLENLEAGRPELTPMPASILVPEGIDLMMTGG